MIREISTIIILILAVFCTTLFSREVPRNQELRIQKVTPDEDDALQNKLNNTNFFSPLLAGKTELGRTGYDYATNNQMGRMLAHSSNGIHFTFMKALPVAATRFVTYDFYDPAGLLFFGNQSVDESLGRTGWGRVVNGKNDEVLMVFHGGGIWLYQDVSEGGYTFSTVVSNGGAVFPALARNGDTVIFASSNSGGAGANPGDTVLVSTDYMQTWTGHEFWQPKDTNITDINADEAWLDINPTNPNEFSFIAFPDITADASLGATFLVTSSDLGATYTATQIMRDDDIFTTKVGLRSYVVQNFGQANAMYTQDGNFHVVIGAVQSEDDTTAAFSYSGSPILYWNTNDQNWTELSTIEAAYPADTLTGPNLRNLAPGNGLGLAYPHISEGPANSELMVVWQQWEDDGAGKMITDFSLMGGAPNTEFFMTNIWGAYSPDGGKTWSEPFYVAGDSGTSDLYPNIPANFSYNTGGDSLILDLAYMLDTNPGTSLFAGDNSDASETVWLYERVAIPISGLIVGIEDEINSVIDDFALAQNYPNPFNPGTKIEYSLQKSAKIKLEVFNLLGQKVATLVDGRKPAGKFTVDFDASHFASGLYFYTLKSGGVKLTRKMMLLK